MQEPHAALPQPLCDAAGRSLAAVHTKLLLHRLWSITPTDSTEMWTYCTVVYCSSGDYLLAWPVYTRWEMSSGTSSVYLAMGAGVLAVAAYCLYYDHARRSAPDYRERLRQSAARGGG